VGGEHVLLHLLGLLEDLLHIGLLGHREGLVSLGSSVVGGRVSMTAVRAG
jgi:hypothetical protein